MPIVLDDVESEGERAEYNKVKTGRDWTLFEMRTLYGIMARGMHNVSTADDDEKHSQHKLIARHLNRCLHGTDNAAKYIPVRAVSAMVKDMIRTNLGGMAFLRRSPARRLTRTTMRRLERELGFDGSIAEWKGWRKMVEENKVKPDVSRFEMPVKKAGVARNAYSRVFDRTSIGDIADSQGKGPMAIRGKKPLSMDAGDLEMSDDVYASGRVPDMAGDGVLGNSGTSTAIDYDGRSSDVLMDVDDDEFETTSDSEDSEENPSPKLSSAVSEEAPQADWSGQASQRIYFSEAPTTKVRDQRNVVSGFPGDVNDLTRRVGISRLGLGNEHMAFFGNATLSARDSATDSLSPSTSMSPGPFTTSLGGGNSSLSSAVYIREDSEVEPLSPDEGRPADMPSPYDSEEDVIASVRGSHHRRSRRPFRGVAAPEARPSVQRSATGRIPLALQGPPYITPAALLIDPDAPFREIEDEWIGDDYKENVDPRFARRDDDADEDVDMMSGDLFGGVEGDTAGLRRDRDDWGGY